MVTPPFAAIDGSTFKLKTATTNRSTRSRWPKTRFRCGWVSKVLAVCVNVRLRKFLRNAATGKNDRGAARSVLVAGRGGHHAAFGLGCREPGRNLFEHREMLVDV